MENTESACPQKLKPAFESKWDRSTRLGGEFPTWCKKLAAAFGGTVETQFPENATRYNDIRLPDGLSFSVHLNGHEGKVLVSGNWPRDQDRQCVTPREACKHGTASISIHVGVDRPHVAIAKDIARRFLPFYREQYAACLVQVKARNDYRNQVAANATRIATVLGCKADDRSGRNSTSEVHLYAHHVTGLYSVRVTSDVRFELTLPVDRAVEVLSLLKKWSAETEVNRE